MTTPSILFECPTCGRKEYHIHDGPHYCDCGAKGNTRTRTGWTLKGPVTKVRTHKQPARTRMTKVNA